MKGYRRRKVVFSVDEKHSDVGVCFQDQFKWSARYIDVIRLEKDLHRSAGVLFGRRFDSAQLAQIQMITARRLVKIDASIVRKDGRCPE